MFPTVGLSLLTLLQSERSGRFQEIYIVFLFELTILIASLLVLINRPTPWILRVQLILGAIPDSIRQTNMTTLDLRSNQLTGESQGWTISFGSNLLLFIVEYNVSA